MADDTPAARRDAPAPARRRMPWFDNLVGFLGGEAASSAEASRRREPAGVQSEGPASTALACGRCSSSGAPPDVPPREETKTHTSLRHPDDWRDARGGGGETYCAPRRRGAPQQHDSEIPSRGAPAATVCGAHHLTRRDHPDRARGGGARWGGGTPSSVSRSGLLGAGRARSACTMFMALALLLLCLVSPISAAVRYHPPLSFP